MIVREEIKIPSVQNQIYFYDNLGYLPQKIAQKSYMSFYHNHPDYVPVSADGTMGFKLRIRIKVRVEMKVSSKFISTIVEDVVKIAQPVLKAVKDVGEFTEEVYDAAKKAALRALPAPLRGFMSDQLNFLEKVVTNPVPNIVRIVEDAAQVAKNIVRETTNAAEFVYHDIARPAFRITRNIANETVFKPVHKVIDVAVLPILPKSIRENVEKIIDVPEAAFAGKLTDKKVVEGLKSYYKLQMLPMKTAGKFANATMNTLRKDAILGPFLDKIDVYSGGLLTSAQNLTTMPDDIYHERDIDWKARLVDALKIYLTVVSAGSVANYAIGLSANAVGTETGINQTPLGRAVLSVGVAYGGAFANGNLTNLAIQDVAKTAVMTQVKGETVKHAVANGWVDDKFTAQMILSAGGKFYDAAGTDKTLMSTMSEIHDKEFQKYIDYQIQKKTGLPITYSNMVDVYNTDWSKLTDNVTNALANIKGVSLSSSDGSLLTKMGQNFVDEMKRVPQNFANISQNVLDEIQRSPTNLANFASAVAKEANKTPENIAKIADNIAREGARGASNVIDEFARTPENVSEIASNVGREIVNTDWGSLVTKYGPDIIPFLQNKYPTWKPGQDFSSEMLDDIDLNYFQKRSGMRPGVLIGGLVGLAALGYFATQE